MSTMSYPICGLPGTLGHDRFSSSSTCSTLGCAASFSAMLALSAIVMPLMEKKMGFATAPARAVTKSA